MRAREFDAESPEMLIAICNVEGARLASSASIIFMR